MTTRRNFLAGAGASTLLSPWLGAGQQSLRADALPANGPAVDPFRNGEALLLVDDHHILYRAGTHRVFHPLTRHPGNPVIRGREHPWEQFIAYNSVHRDPDTGRYQMWYQSAAGNIARRREERCTVCYAESNDGISWTKPALNLFEFNGQARTNMVLMANGGTSDRYGASVLFDPRDSNPARRYKMAYFDFSVDHGREYPGLSVAFSPDGIHWTKYPRAPLLRAAYGSLGDEVPFADQPDKGTSIALSVADAVDAIYDPLANAFAIYGKMWIDGPEGLMYGKHAAHRAVSKDFVHWERPMLVMTPDDDDPPWVEFHTTPVFYYSGCYFATPQILHRQERGGVMDVELAISRDGVHFSRPFRKTFWLPKNSSEKTFDGGTLVTNSTPVILDDEIRIYYGGYSGGATGADDLLQLSGVGLATMPRDRFAGVRPRDAIGQITLKPLDLTGCREIQINANASAGSVRVELLDDNGYRMRGYSKQDARPITGDSLRHTVAWKEKTLKDLPPGRYMPRLHLERAEVFALSCPLSLPGRGLG